MKLIKKSSPEEYNSLRTEIISRIQYLGTNGLGTATIVLAIWTICFTLFMIENGKTDINADAKLFVQVAQLILYVMPIVILIPTAYKVRDYFSQIAAISAYLKVVHELPSIINNESGDNEILFWETIQESSWKEKTKDENAFSKRLKFICAEYVFLALISIILMIVFAIHELHLYFKLCLWTHFTMFSIATLVLLILSSFGLYRIFKASSAKINMVNSMEEYKESFLNELLLYDIIDEEAYDLYYKKMNIHNRGQYKEFSGKVRIHITN